MSLILVLRSGGWRSSRYRSLATGSRAEPGLTAPGERFDGFSIRPSVMAERGVQSSSLAPTVGGHLIDLDFPDHDGGVVGSSRRYLEGCSQVTGLDPLEAVRVVGLPPLGYAIPR